MKIVYKRISFIPIVIALCLWACLSAHAQEEAAPGDASVKEVPPLVMADFDSGKKPNNVKGDFGSWNYSPNDETQGCWDSFEAVNYDGKQGYSILLDYDVKSPNPAFCGFWAKLVGIDIDAYDVLSFYLKGDAKAGFTSRFKIELKTRGGRRAIYTINGVDATWQAFNIPFKQTRAVSDWSKMEEFTIVFDDILTTKKVGKIYLDQITFRKFSPEEQKIFVEAQKQQTRETPPAQ